MKIDGGRPLDVSHPPGAVVADRVIRGYLFIYSDGAGMLRVSAPKCLEAVLELIAVNSLELESILMHAISHEAVWFLSAMMTVGAIIDQREKRVPNLLTFPLAFSGVAYWAFMDGGSGLMWGLVGLAFGLILLLPAYGIGWMGAGDVKLFACVGAWMGPHIGDTWWAFATGVMVGGLMGVFQMGLRGIKAKRGAEEPNPKGLIGRARLALQGLFSGFLTMWGYTREVFEERLNIDKLNEKAAARKPQMDLIPYGVPLTIGSIAYFAWTGLLF